MEEQWAFGNGMKLRIEQYGKRALIACKQDSLAAAKGRESKRDEAPFRCDCDGEVY